MVCRDTPNRSAADSPFNIPRWERISRLRVNARPIATSSAIRAARDWPLRFPFSGVVEVLERPTPSDPSNTPIRPESSDVRSNLRMSRAASSSSSSATRWVMNPNVKSTSSRCVAETPPG